MNYSIYKYPLKVVDEQVVNLHEGGGLCAKYVSGEIVMYAFVDTTSTPIPVTVRMFGTGQQIPEDEIPYLQYIDTVVEPIGDMVGVWHVYVKLPSP
jgi:hypothetical protein